MDLKYLSSLPCKHRISITSPFVQNQQFLFHLLCPILMSFSILAVEAERILHVLQMGETYTITLTMTVLEFPPRESCRSLVSLELRYGICVLLPSTSAEITLPRVESDKLIFVASFSRCPVAPVFVCLSDPCNETKQLIV